MGNTSDHSSFSSRFYLVRVDLSQVTDLIGLEELNVHSYYQIGLWNYCTSTEINSSFLRGIVFCSKRETPFRGLPKILDAINFGIIGEWRDKLKTATYAIFFLLMVAIANALIACPLHIFSHKSRVIAIAATAIAVLTALTSVATAVLVTVTYTTVADKINSSGHLIHAQKGTAGKLSRNKECTGTSN